MNLTIKTYCSIYKTVLSTLSLALIFRVFPLPPPLVLYTKGHVLPPSKILQTADRGTIHPDQDRGGGLGTSPPKIPFVSRCKHGKFR